MYRTVIGTGGIGTGIFFRLRENRALGRNESRGAELTNAKDYCKQHIVLYYVSMLLSPGVQVIPVGKVGADETGARMKRLMERAGMNIEYVDTSLDAPTMVSICLQYPDKCGCNVTADNSACSEVTSEYILHCAHQLDIDRHTMVVALPEVPLEARVTLLRYGKERHAFTTASLTVSEAEAFIKMDGLKYCDLLALNEEETAAVAGVQAIRSVEDGLTAARRLVRRYPWLKLWITLGKLGSMTADRDGIRVYPALSGVDVINTGGAGDASLGGVIAGLCMGLPFHGTMENGFKSGDLCDSAAALGVLLGGLSVESADSINESINWPFIHRLLSFNYERMGR